MAMAGTVATAERLNRRPVMMKAKDVMTTPVVTISPDATLADATRLLDTKGITGVPVADADGKVIGILTEKDILVLAYTYVGNLRETKVREAMTGNVVTFPSDTSLEAIAKCFAKSDFRRVPIVDEGKLVGIISRRDLVHLMTVDDFRV
jgi:CBS domain-containing protein